MLGKKVTLIRDTIDRLADDFTDDQWESISEAWAAIVHALEAAESMLLDVEAMEEPESMYGPFNEASYDSVGSGPYSGGILVLWPNLEISSYQFRKKLEALK